MQKDRFLQMQEVSKRPDMAPGYTYYVWSVDLPVTSHTLEEQYHVAMRNLKLRRAAMITANTELTSRFTDPALQGEGAGEDDPVGMRYDELQVVQL